MDKKPKKLKDFLNVKNEKPDQFPGRVAVLMRAIEIRASGAGRPRLVLAAAHLVALGDDDLHLAPAALTVALAVWSAFFAGGLLLRFMMPPWCAIERASSLPKCRQGN